MTIILTTPVYTDNQTANLYIRLLGLDFNLLNVLWYVSHFHFYSYPNILFDAKFIVTFLSLTKMIILNFVFFRSLQRTLNDLKDYQRKHDFWQQQNTKLQTEQVTADVKLVQEQTFDQHSNWQATAHLCKIFTILLLPNNNLFGHEKYVK